jgi:hypothetical protein
MTLSGHSDADEDEIMDNIFGRFSKEGRTPSGHKTGQKHHMQIQDNQNQVASEMK